MAWAQMLSTECNVAWEGEEVKNGRMLEELNLCTTARDQDENQVIFFSVAKTSHSRLMLHSHTKRQ